MSYFYAANALQPTKIHPKWNRDETKGWVGGSKNKQKNDAICDTIDDAIITHMHEQETMLSNGRWVMNGRKICTCVKCI